MQVTQALLALLILSTESNYFSSASYFVLADDQFEHAVSVTDVATVLDSNRTADSQPPPLLSFENTPAPQRPGRLSVDTVQDGGPTDISSSTYLDSSNTENYIALCAVARDAHQDIREWVYHHHNRLGISVIYIFDHGSSPPMNETLQVFIDAQIVVYTYFVDHGDSTPQLYAYDSCLSKYGHRHPWIAFIDVDEFFMFRGGSPIQSLAHFLKPFEDQGVSGLGVHWILFGSSGHKDKPIEGVLRSYVMCMPQNHDQHTLIKSIVRPICTERAWGPHAFKHNCSTPVVRTDGSTILGPRSEGPGVFDSLVLHHYATKSEHEFSVKIEKGSGMKRQRGWEYFNFVNAWSVEYCLDGLRVWDDSELVPMDFSGLEEEQLEKYRNDAHETYWAIQQLQEQQHQQA